MLERLVPLDFFFEARADADGVWMLDIPVQITIVGVEYTLDAVSGTVTAADIDIQDDATDVITAIALAAYTKGSRASWKSKDFGGANAAVQVAAGSILEIDLNITGGGSCGLNGTIWALLGALKA